MIQSLPSLIATIRTAAIAAALISPAIAQAEVGISREARECDARTVPERSSDKIADWLRAVEACHKAAHDDISTPQLITILGKAFEKARQYEGAAFAYNIAADLGYANAQDNLGALYANGEGVPKDIVRAMVLFRKAADQGLANAQLNLGKMYSDKKNFAQAAIWYRKAAEQGDIEAASHLGSILYNEVDGPENDREAVYWLKKAAAAGDLTAQNNLVVVEENRRVQARAARGPSEYDRTKQDIERSRQLRCGSYQMSGNRMGMSMSCY